MKRIYSIILVLLLALTGMAQTGQEYNVYTRDKFLFNPAQTGENFGLKALVDYRRKWTGFDGAPEISTFALDYRSNDKVGLGAMVHNFKHGIINDLTFQLGYSYRLQLVEEHFLRLGITGGFLSHNYNIGDVIITNPQDPVLMNDELNTIRFRGGIGAAYHWKDLNVDLSLPNLVRGGHLKGDFYALASYDFYLNSQPIKIQPSVMFRTIPGSDDLGHFAVAGEWQETVWAQFGYSLNDEFIMAFAFNHKGMEIGYSYGVATGDISHVSEGNHEVRLAFNFGHGKGKGWKPSFKIPVRKEVQSISNENEEEEKALAEERKKEIESLKTELNKLKEDFSSELESVKQSVVNLKEDEINVEEENNPKGYYVIISSYKDMEPAEKGLNLLREKGIDAKIIENKTKKRIYIYTDQFSSLSSALVQMRKERKKGFSKAWVLVL